MGLYMLVSRSVGGVPARESLEGMDRPTSRASCRPGAFWENRLENSSSSAKYDWITMRMSSGDFWSAMPNHFRALVWYESKRRLRSSDESRNSISVPVKVDRNSNLGEYYHQHWPKKCCIGGGIPNLFPELDNPPIGVLIIQVIHMSSLRNIIKPETSK